MNILRVETSQSKADKEAEDKAVASSPTERRGSDPNQCPLQTRLTQLSVELREIHCGAAQVAQ